MFLGNVGEMFHLVSDFNIGQLEWVRMTEWRPQTTSSVSSAKYSLNEMTYYTPGSVLSSPITKLIYLCSQASNLTSIQLSYLINRLLDERPELVLGYTSTTECKSFKSSEFLVLDGHKLHLPDQTAIMGSAPKSSHQRRYSKRPRPL